MVAGRSVPVYMLVATLVCTWIGSGSLFGTAGLTFRTEISVLWFSFGAWVGILIACMVIAGYQFKGDPGGGRFLGVSFPMDTDYIAIPAVHSRCCMYVSTAGQKRS